MIKSVLLLIVLNVYEKLTLTVPLQRTKGLAFELLHDLLLAWQNYWMLIGWGEYNYFINCTAVQLMIFPKQTKWRKGTLNTSVKWNCCEGTRLKYEQKQQILLEQKN